MASYVIRLTRWSDYNASGIQPKVFACRDGHSELSIHLYDGELAADRCLKYWNHDWGIVSGDKPGICLIDDADFLACKLPLPIFDQDYDDKTFGHLRYIIRPCLTDEQSAA